MTFNLRAACVAAIAVVALPFQVFATDILVINSDRVLNDSAVGQHIKTKLQEIQETIISELKAEGTPVKEEWEAFQTELAPLNREALSERTDLQERGRELQKKYVQLSVSEQVKGREYIATQAKALQPVREALDEVLQTLVDERGAGIMVERELLVFAADSVDVTDLVIERLNAKMKTTPVERVVLPVEAPAAE